jgi:hypothetical protein
MHRFRIASGLYGCFPFFLVLAKIQFHRAEDYLTTNPPLVPCSWEQAFK